MDAPVLHVFIDDEGIPRTIERRVKVHMIAEKHLVTGESVADIAVHYDIALADVHAALTYYYDNLPYFEGRERERQPLIDDAKRYTTDLNARIQQRMGHKDND